MRFHFWHEYRTLFQRGGVFGGVGTCEMCDKWSVMNVIRVWRFHEYKWMKVGEGEVFVVCE